MNFLSTFIRLFIALGVFALIGFFGGRELWLFAASQQVVSDARLLLRTTQWEDYIGGCNTGVITGNTPFEGFQLRFVDQQQYVLEVDCATQKPVLRETMDMLMGVKKTFGSAGFYYDFQSKEFFGEVQIEFLGRTRVVYVDGETVGQTWGETSYVTAKPASACSAYGYVCCHPENEQGVGDGLSAGVIDCSQNCFSSCMQRPILLAFQTDPPVDYETRTTTVQGTSGLVLFSYAFDESAAAVETVTIDFGDGTNEVFSGEASGLSTKEYSCPSGRCVFTATVNAVDERGVESPVSRLSSLTIVIDATAQAGI